MDIKLLAKDIIVALNLIPEEDVWLDVIIPDWNGTPKVYITSEPTKPENQTQFGAISETTLLAIHVLANPREEAVHLRKQAADAVYAKFEELERQRGSGVLCILPAEHSTVQCPDFEAYQSNTIFSVLHL